MAPDYPDAPRASEDALRAALRAFVGDLLDTWGDHTAAARWRNIPEEDCTATQAATILADVVCHPPLVLDPARLHRIEEMMRRLLFYLAWRRMGGRLDDAELSLWMTVLESWQARAWSTRGRISA